MPAAWNRNRLTAKLGIDYPIIQGPLGGLSSQRLTATVSNYGGLGSFGAHSLTPAAITDVIAQIRSLTAKPFAMNLWVSMEDEGARTSDESRFNRSLAPLAAHLAELGVARPEYEPYVVAFLDSLVEDVAAIAGPVMQWSADRRQKHSRLAQAT
jgi:nitronate monooxygenase